MLQTRDFDGMKVNPNNISGYPHLKQIFQKVNEKEAKYIVLMYDHSTPLKTFFPDLQSRKIYAAGLAGLDKAYDTQGLFDMKNGRVVEAVGEFLKQQNSLLWSLIIANEETFDEYRHRVLTRVEEGEGEFTVGDKDMLAAVEKKIKLLDAMHNIRARLDSYYREFYGDDMKVKEEVKAKRATPENMANV